MPVLITYGNEFNGEQLAFPGDCLRIGRSIECDLPLRSKSVSEKHAQLIIRDKVCWLQDLGSTTGTVFKKRKINQVSLEPGEEFFIDSYRFVYESSPDDYHARGDATLEGIRRTLHVQLIDKLDLKRLKPEQMGDKALRRRASDLLETLIRTLDEQKQIPPQLDREQLQKMVLDAALGLGPLEDLLADPEVTEIMVNAPQQIYIERKGRLHKSQKVFLDEVEVRTALERIVSPIGRRIDESTPMVDARLRDGSRVHAIIPPLALNGPTITIRKFPSKRILVSDLVAYGTLSEEMAKLLRLCVLARKNMVISGGTGSGKTTLLNVLGSFIPEGDRIITIEDSAELRLPQEHVVRMETRPPNLEGRGEISIRDLVRNSLRMRPDRIVVGECRGGEAFDMLQAMNTGHDGSLTTCHANTPEDAVRRLENLVLQGMELPLRAIRELIFSAIHIIVQISRFSDGSRKLTSIAEISSIYDGEIRLQELFGFHRTGITDEGKISGYHAATGVIPTFVEEMREAGIDADMSIFVPGSKI